MLCCLLGITPPRFARRKVTSSQRADAGSCTCPRSQSFRDCPMSSAIPWALPLAQYRAHRAPIQNAINRVLDSGNYILGAELDSFERAFAAYCRCDHAVGVGSGTDALI